MNRTLIAVLKTLSGIEDTDYPYYHVSDHPETPSVLPKGKREYDDPAAIYLFIKGEGVGIDEWEQKKYRWDAKLKSEDNLLDILEFGNDFEKVMKALGIKKENFKETLESEGAPEEWIELHNEVIYLDEVIDDLEGFFKKNPWRLYEFVRGYFQDRRELTQFFKKLGYSGILDREGCCIYGTEPQLIVFDPSNIIWSGREKNVPDPKVYVL